MSAPLVSLGRPGRTRSLLCAFLLIVPAGIVVRDSCFCQTGKSAREFLPADLVEITLLDSTIRLDIRYATENNFMGRRMYSAARAFLQRSAAEALVRVNAKLRPHGYGLLVFDGYRPWSVTKRFWDETPVEKRSFVADPKVGSRHNRGCAVDLSLYALASGREVEMPSPYDEFSARASPEFDGGTGDQRKMRDLLRGAMESEGFSVNSGEWWHFDYKEWEDYEILDLKFEEIK